MKPGPFPFAENEAYAGGPDIGSDTRTEPPSANQTDGYYRTYRPAPDVLAYQLHRSAKLQEFLARMHASNVDVVDNYTTGNTYDYMVSATHGIGDTVLTDPRNYVFYYCLEDGASVYEVRCDDDQVLGETAMFGPIGVFDRLDSDHENNKTNHHRIVVCDDGAGSDLVQRSTTLAGAWAGATFGGGAGPGYNWRAVGCDRDPSGSPVWCIGSDVQGGQTYIYRSTDGIDFNSAGAGYPSATVTTDLQFLKHTRHYANALGPHDSGNASWLALSDTYAVRSSDSITWTAAAHGMNLGGGSLHARSAAYSKTSGRWICPRINSAAGDVYYSDDNGATWSTFSGVIPEVGSVAEFFVSGDGHGTFVATWTNSWPQFIVSVDEGATWSSPIGLKSSTSGFTEDEGFFPEFVIDEVSQAYEQPNGPEYLSMGALDSTTLVDLYRSLLY